MSDPSDELDAVAPELEALGRRAEQRELDERAPEWEAVASGELGVDEAGERRRAAGDDAADVERAAAYFRPFDADETGALIDDLLGGLGPSEAERVAEVIPLAKPDKPPEPEQKPQPKHDPGSSGFWWIPGGMLLAAAAAIAVWWVWPPSEEVRGLTDTTVASLEPLPAYVLETDGGLKQLRSDTDGGADESGRHRYRRDTKFEWILRPKVDEAGEVGVRGFAFVDGSSAGLPLAALNGLAEVAGSGAIRIAGTIDQLDLEPGRYTIALAIGRPAQLPTQATELDADPDAAWQVRRVEIEIED